MPLHPQSKEEIAERLVSNFQSSYLTLISIIQGVAFGICATNVHSTFILKGTSPWFLIYPVLSFMSIIIVFYCYSWFVSFVFAKPDLRESLIPFILGASQVAPMLFFDNPKYWWLSFSFFSLSGAMAYRNTIQNLKSRTYNEECADIPSYINDQMDINISMCCIASYISSSAYFYMQANRHSVNMLEAGHIIFLVLLSAPTVILLYTTQHRFLNRMYELLDLKNNTYIRNTDVDCSHSKDTHHQPQA